MGNRESKHNEGFTLYLNKLSQEFADPYKIWVSPLLFGLVLYVFKFAFLFSQEV